MEGERWAHRDIVRIWPNTTEGEKLRENVRERRREGGREERHLTLTGSSKERMSANTRSHTAPTRR